jgi:positive phototaxis protein PixI
MSEMTDTSTSEQLQQFLSFRASLNTQAMLPTQQMLEVLNLSHHQIVPIPDTSTEVVGVCNWRGEVLWLVNLGYLLTDNPDFTQEKYQINYTVIIIHHNSMILGLVVEQVHNMLWCNPAQIQSIPASYLVKTSSLIQGYWLNSQQDVLLILDAEALIHSFCN